MAKFRPLVVAIACVVTIGGVVLPTAALTAETVKTVWIDSLPGLMGTPGQNQLCSWQYVAELATQKNWVGDGAKFEVVGFDNKLSPQGSLAALRQVADQGVHYIAQGNGSSVSMALEDAVAKYNERNPGKEIVYLNYAAVDPDMTNSKCNYQYFRLDASSGMKMEAPTSSLAKDPKVKKVYLINQNYSFGHQVVRVAKEYLKHKRPDIKIVDEDLHPLAQVKSSSSYVSKIKSSGADTVITGNWDSDLALLIKAGKDAGPSANFYTYYASTTGVPTAMGSAGTDHVKYVGYWNVSNDGYKSADIVEGYKEKHNDDYYLMASYTGIAMLAKAIKQTKSTESARVAKAFEGMKADSLNGIFEMHASDHRGQQPFYIATWERTNGKNVKFDQGNIGHGWKVDMVFDQHVASQPTPCQMKRP